ncbi:MAG TPA: zinc ribbon domain-containing protein [Vicinamibacteria bacterium]|nr:zinc ribbon domain-containing protein [Vicinamibacteria bacterium]
MPLYEYRCLGCGRLFEKLVRTWNEAVDCPACASQEIEKQLSTFAMTGTDGGRDRGTGTGMGGGACCGRGGCGCH